MGHQARRITTEARSKLLARSLGQATLEVTVLSSLLLQHVVAPAWRRELAKAAMRSGISARRACVLFRVARSALHYSSRRAAADHTVVQALREILDGQPRIGYRYALVLLRERGVRMNAKRLHRIWRDYGLSPRRRDAGTPRRRGPTRGG